MTWETVIGLEIHVQLATKTKLFCGCSPQFGSPPNTHTCQVCLGHPGVLPVLNAEAVRLAIVVGSALGCEIAEETIFHRKNYFYPDLPKAYQISQFDNPICGPGSVSVLTEDGEFTVAITRAHLEEDAAKLIHLSDDGRRAGASGSVVDFNRGGTPLVEIVTEPDLRSAQDATRFLRQLRQTLLFLGISDCNMDEGSLRCDANISIRAAGSTELGTKTELKNMNSFRFLERGMDAEIARQIALVESGGRVVQETLHFDVESGELHALRSKEEAHDYRYLPEPDLVPVVPDPAWIAELRAGLPELPGEIRRRWTRDLGLTYEDAEVLSQSPALVSYFEETASKTEAKGAANWIRGELRAQLRETGQEPWESKVTPTTMAELVELVSSKTISQPSAKEVLAEMIASGAGPAAVVAERNLGQIGGDDELRTLVKQLFADNPAQAQDLRGGKTKLLGFFVGQAMKASGGRVDAGALTAIIHEETQ